MALYVGWSGLQLARENLRYLMGEAPEPQVLEELRGRAGSVRGIRAVTEIAAHFVGPTLHVHATVEVDATVAVLRALLGVGQQHEVVGHLEGVVVGATWLLDSRDRVGVPTTTEVRVSLPLNSR